MRARDVLGGAALGVLAALAVLSPVVTPAQAAQTSVVVHACDEGAPEGWSVIEDASGAWELGALCNYLVERFVEDVNQSFVSGIAITVEYFCTAQEATEAFLGKTGRSETRDRTTTFRSDTKLVTEEGPAAKNKDNPQGDREIFGFGPVPYYLQEKAWELISPQIVTTTVVLTNERGPTTEDKRFGIAAATPEIIRVVNNHLPTKCAVPAVGDGTSSPTGGKGGSRTVAVSGIAGVVAIGGTIIWRRQRGRTPARPASPFTDVPPECLQHSKAYEDHRETVLTLREAFTDLEQEWNVAHRVHRINILKANAVLGIELGSYLGSAVDDFARSMKPRAPHVREPMDNWKPPGGLDAKMAAAFQSAMDVLAQARLKVNGLRDQLRNATSAISSLARHPLVREAQERAAAALQALRRAEVGLEPSRLARASLDALDDNIDQVSRAAAKNYEPVSRLEANIETFRGYITTAKNDIEMLTGTVDGANPAATPVAHKNLLTKKAGLESMERQVQRDLTELGPLKAKHQDTMRNLDTLMGRREGAMRELARHGDILPADVEKLRGVHQRLLAEAAATQNRALGDLSGQYDAARAALKAAEIEEGLAQAYLKGLRAQLDRGAQPGIVKQGVNVGVSIVMSPVTLVLWAWEKGFGTTQSAGEIWEILMRGEERLEEMTRNITRVERAIRTTQQQVQILQGQLKACIDAAAGGPGQAAPAFPAPTGNAA